VPDRDAAATMRPELARGAPAPAPQETPALNAD